MWIWHRVSKSAKIAQIDARTSTLYGSLCGSKAWQHHSGHRAKFNGLERPPNICVKDITYVGFAHTGFVKFPVCRFVPFQKVIQHSHRKFNRFSRAVPTDDGDAPKKLRKWNFNRKRTLIHCDSSFVLDLASSSKTGSEDGHVAYVAELIRDDIIASRAEIT